MTEDPTLQQAAAPSGWPHALADRLFTAPPRWGWRFVDTPVPDTPPGLAPQYAPQWDEPPRAADLWHPVPPAAAPTRIAVLGGEPHRHGWASLLVTLGTSVLGGRERIAVLDFTGRDVAGGLAEVAQAGGYPVRRVDLPAVAARVNLLAGLGEQNLAECLGYTLSGSPETGEYPHVRALATELVQRMVGCLDGPVTLCRLAAAVRVLRRLAPGPALSPAEVAALVDLIGEVSQDDWSVKHLQLIGIRLGLLAELEA